jgi:hypothetical protein
VEESRNHAPYSALGTTSAPRNAGETHNHPGTRHPYRVPGSVRLEAPAPSEKQFQAAVVELATLTGGAPITRSTLAGRRPGGPT